MPRFRKDRVGHPSRFGPSPAPEAIAPVYDQHDAPAARRKDRLDDLAAEIEKAGGNALVVAADITDRIQAEGP